MSISIITPANLGKKSNLKTTDIVPVIEAFADQGELIQVICNINSGYSFPNTKTALPSGIRFIIGALRRIGLSLDRRRVERLFDMFAARKLEKADIYLFHGGYFLPKTTLRARALNSVLIDIAVSARLETNAAIEKKELATLGFALYKGLYSHLTERATSIDLFNYVIVMSQFVKDSYVNSGFPAERIFIATPDIDLKRFNQKKAELKNNTFKAVYVAYTAPLKGLHYLLDAWNDLNLPNAELTIVGGYSDTPKELEKRYDKIIAENPSIKKVGSSQSPELYYQDASVFVFPSLTEGFGRVTLEAMASGLPVITTENAKGIVEDGKTGFVVPIRDTIAIREKIKFFYDNRDIAEQMGKDARKAAENKKSFGKSVFEIYQEIMRRENKTIKSK